MAPTHPRVVAGLTLCLVLPLLSGCIGGTDEGAGTASLDGAPGESIPELPDDLAIDGAQLVHRSPTSATFLWEDVLPPSVIIPDASLDGSTEERTAEFPVPGGLELLVEATLTWTTDGDLTLAILNDGGSRVCADYGPGEQAVSAPAAGGDDRRRTCWAKLHASGADGTIGALLVGADHNLADSPFTVDVTLTSLPRHDLHGVADLLPFETIADDGIGLRGHVYLPDGEGPFATVLEYSPYWNTAYWHSEASTMEDGERTTLRNWLGRFMDAGFAVALVNMRGTGESDGCMNWGGPRDWQDAATVIEALADQEWSNGNIGMYGLSYPGWTQYMAIAGAPPSLKATIPASGVIDLYSLTVYNGASSQSHPILTTLFTAGTAGTGFMALSGQLGDTSPDHLACPRYGEDVDASLGPAYDGDRMPYYDERDLRPYIATTSVPMLVTNGLTNGEGHTYQFEGLWDLIPHEEKRFMLGQWPHAFPDSNHDATRDDFADMAVAWFDHYLRGGPKTIETGVVEYQSDDMVWHTADRWPPAATTTTLHLSGGELIADEGAVGPSQQTFTSQDWRPLPDGCVGDKAVFVSPPLAEDVLIAGNAQYNLTLTSTMPDGNLAVHLWHTPGLFPCDMDRHDQSLSGDFGEYEMALGHTDLRHRGHLARGQDFPVGEPGEVMLKSEPFASFVPAGDRLVITVGGGDWDLLPDPRKPSLTVLTGPDVVGEIVLPVVEGTLVFEAGSAGSGSVVAAVVG